MIWSHSFGEYTKIVKGIIGERRENEREKSKRMTKHERLLTGKRTRGSGRGGGWRDGVTG